MKSWNEIQKMNKEELAAENKKLVRRLVLTKVVLPVVAMTVVHYGLKYLDRTDPITED